MGGVNTAGNTGILSSANAIKDDYDQAKGRISIITVDDVNSTGGLKGFDLLKQAIDDEIKTNPIHNKGVGHIIIVGHGAKGAGMSYPVSNPTIDGARLINPVTADSVL